MKQRKPLTDPLRAVAYIRVSTDEQQLGPEAQRADIERWCASKGITSVSMFTDVGVSGGAEISERPQLILAFEAVRALKAGTFVVWRRDRLARDVGIAAIIERELDRLGARVRSVHGEGTDVEGPAGKLMSGIIDAFSEFERGVIRMRTKAALKTLRAKGKRAGDVPWGYSALSDGTLVPNEGERRLVERARELHTEGWTVRAIAEQLAEEGFRNRKGKLVPFTRLHMLLSQKPA